MRIPSQVQERKVENLVSASVSASPQSSPSLSSRIYPSTKLTHQDQDQDQDSGTGKCSRRPVLYKITSRHVHYVFSRWKQHVYDCRVCTVGRWLFFSFFPPKTLYVEVLYWYSMFLCYYCTTISCSLVMSTRCVDVCVWQGFKHICVHRFNLHV